MITLLVLEIDVVRLQDIFRLYHIFLKLEFTVQKKAFYCTFVLMKMNKRIKRLVVNLKEEEHQSLKVLAAKKNITMSKMVMQAITLYIEKAFRSCN